MRTVQGSVTITYAVPITFIVLTPKLDPVNVVDGVSSTFSCVTSESRPPATVSWFKGIDDITAFSNNVTTTFITTSTLTYTPSKEDQGKRIRCEGSNGGTTVTTSVRPLANIQFGPSIPCDYAGTDAPPTIMIREGWNFSLNCTSSGNPKPSLTWTHPGPGPNSPLALSNIQKSHNGTFTVTSSNTLAPSGEAHVPKSNSSSYIVLVMYPPASIQCTVGSASSLGSGTLRVVKDSTFTISCVADSVPASTWEWSWSGGSISSYQLSAPNIQTEGPFTVTARNTFTLTNGSTETGRNQNECRLQLLYPPSRPVFHLGGTTGPRITENSLSVIRGKSTSVACISTGNPEPTYSSWNGSDQLWTFIANTDTTRTCLASNTLNPTGFKEELRSISSALNIKVVYGASIADFAITGLEGREKVVLFDGSRVSLHCAVDSNPGSYIEILKDGQSLKQVGSAQKLSLVIERIKCEDDGIYICTGRNVHDSAPVMRTLTVFVKCSPRASTASPSVYLVTSVTGVPANLTFTLVAYPRPDMSDFRWEKQDVSGDGWTTMHNTQNVKLVVSVNRLQTSISFTSVQKVDFGYYRVNASNELGRTSEIFHLQSQAGPSSGPVIGGAVGGSIGGVVAIVLALVVLRRKYTHKCNIKRKTDAPPGKSVSCADNSDPIAAQTHEEISMTTNATVYDILAIRDVRPDSSHEYMPLEQSSLKSNTTYENVK
ncbi:hemicentin-1-like isoform X2 [Mya arenaria]|uniref:hemicentin-1-like isoform X2 n=1 Tax=Mya arenaria TaxID=6604 RepID=UPI0022E23B10|nr:hemicentin-1-like isoform X2 [Mya arenaria]